jgi:large subunit ribosomal protein L25
LEKEKMANEFELNAELRTDLGKGASRRLRRIADLVPAVIYGAGKDPVSISIPHKDIQKACRNEAFFAHIIKINVPGGSDNAIIKDLQRHPAKDRIMHADFLRVQMDQEITVEIPLHFINEDNCVGVKQDGGMISHVITSLEISCLPGALPEYIEIDVAEMKLGDTIHMSQIKLPEGVAILELAHGEDHDQVVVAINASRADTEGEGDADDAAAEGDAPAATED